jgi:hypothetical protein
VVPWTRPAVGLIMSLLLFANRDDLPVQSLHAGLQAQPPGYLLDPEIVASDGNQFCAYPYTPRAPIFVLSNEPMRILSGSTDRTSSAWMWAASEST